MTALKLGHTPVVIPRLAQLGEHVDDHQLDIATRFAERGLVRCAAPGSDLTLLLTPRDTGRARQIGRGSTELRATVAAAAAAESRRARISFFR